MNLKVLYPEKRTIAEHYLWIEVQSSNVYDLWIEVQSSNVYDFFQFLIFHINSNNEIIEFSNWIWNITVTLILLKLYILGYKYYWTFCL